MDVRQALLDAAVKAFAEGGMRGATTRRIAQQAGVNEVTLFRHFQSKRELMHAALEQFARQATLRALPQDPVDPEAELTTWCRDHHRDLYKVRALIRRSMGEFEQDPRQCAHGMHASGRIADELTAYLVRLRRKGLAGDGWDERAATAMLMGALFTDALGRDIMPERYPYSMRGAITRYVQLFLNAIGVKKPGPGAGPSSTP
jgi:AcrR family transcriptional regulator